MDDSRTAKRIADCKPIGRRIRGRHKKKWTDDVEDDLRSMNVRGWRKLFGEGTELKKVIAELKTTPACDAKRRRRLILYSLTS